MQANFGAAADFGPPLGAIVCTFLAPAEAAEPGTLGDMRQTLMSLLVLCFASTALTEEVSLTTTQLNALATEALHHTPENTHFAKGATFKWVIFVAPNPDPYPRFTETLRRELGKRYVVYASRSELPVGATRKDEMGEWLVNGFQYSVSVRGVSSAKIEVLYQDFEGPLAAGWQTVTYKWSRKKWHVVSKGPLTVA